MYYDKCMSEFATLWLKVFEQGVVGDAKYRS